MLSFDGKSTKTHAVGESLCGVGFTLLVLGHQDLMHMSKMDPKVLGEYIRDTLCTRRQISIQSTQEDIVDCAVALTL